MFYIPIRTYHPSEAEEKIAYFPDGSEKYGVYTVDTTNPEQPLLEVELKVQGATVWKHVFSGKTVGGKMPIDRGQTLLEKGWGWVEWIARR
jgi:hypothetical protein